jgi:hypothetical protein
MSIDNQTLTIFNRGAILSATITLTLREVAMGEGRVIDMDSQFASLFNTEEMLAFYPFRMTPDGSEQVEGLCKISRPKEGKNGGKYFSLIFIIDTPNDATRRGVEASLKKINWAGMDRLLPEIECVLPILYPDKGKENLLAEYDIFVSKSCELSRSYLFRNLFPAIARTSGFDNGELIFWDNTKEPAKPTPTEQKNGQSLLQRLKDLLFD